MEFGKAPLNMETKRKLAGFFESGRLPHALLLEAGTAEGRNSLASLLARGAVCRSFGTGGTGAFPCGECPDCRKALAGSHPDLYTAGGGLGPALRVDEIRRIRAEAFVRPNEADRKVYLLLESQEMTEQAQNALLKVLEEPPSGVLFLLTAPSSSLLLHTIRSRVQSVRLEQEEKAEDPELLERVAGIARAVCLPGEAELLYRTAPLIRDKESLRRVLALLAVLFRDSCVLRAGGRTCLSGLREPAESLSRELTRGSLMRLLEAVERAQREQEGNANAALLVTVLCARLRLAAGR